MMQQIVKRRDPMRTVGVVTTVVSAVGLAALFGLFVRSIAEMIRYVKMERM